MTNNPSPSNATKRMAKILGAEFVAKEGPSPKVDDGLVARLRMDAAEYAYLDEAADRITGLTARLERYRVALVQIRDKIPLNCAAWGDEMDIRTIAETALSDSTEGEV